jgi:hypothetical protein
MAYRETVDLLRECITDEIFFALGFKKLNIWRRLFGPLLRQPTERFANIFARADEAIGVGGLAAGSRSILDEFGVTVHAEGSENLPKEGPLLVVSNHPGAYDSLALSACMGRRDLKVLVFESKFYRAMPNGSACLIYAKHDPTSRMIALREAIQHLCNGGAQLLFGTGRIEPDPAVLPQPGVEAAIRAWSPSVEVMLRKAPETCLGLAVTSGVLQKRFLQHPLTHLRRTPIDKRRLAEMAQVIQQLISPKSVKINMQITFAPTIRTEVLAQESSGQRWLSAIIQRELRLLDEHLEAYNLKGSISPNNSRIAAFK